MFEKEAEEYLKKDGTKAEQILDMLNEISPLKITLKQVPFILAMIQQVFKDGAEFGYNKAFVEADKNLKAIVTDFNKANEWHYVKDGKYPAHSNRVLVFTDEGVGFGIYGLDNKKWYTYDTGFDVIAWKEIVLPKESE